jgi:hypothetical protein
MQMPEAAVDKDDLAAGNENQIRLTREVFPMKTEPETQPVGQPPYNHLRLRVSRPDCSHIGASAGFRKLISHNLYSDRYPFL